MVSAFTMFAESFGTTGVALGTVGSRILVVGSSPIVVSAVVIFHSNCFGNEPLGFLGNRCCSTERTGCDLVYCLVVGKLLDFFGIEFLNPSVIVQTSWSIHSLVEGSRASREIAVTLVSATLLVDGALFSISRKEFNSRARASSAVAGLDFLSSPRSVETLRPSMKLVSKICSTK